MLIPMLTALGAVSGAAGGLAYAQRKRNAMIVDAVRAGQAVGALAAVRALEEGERSDGGRVERAALAAKAAREIGFVAIRHQVAICKAVEDGTAPEIIAEAMDGPCCMAARLTRLRDRGQTVNAATFRALLSHVDAQHRAANAPPSGGTLDAAAVSARLADVIEAEAAVVLAWFKFNRDERAEKFGTMIADRGGRMQSAKEIHRMFRAVEAQAREAADVQPEIGTGRARVRRVPGVLSTAQRRRLGAHLDAIDALNAAAERLPADDTRRQAYRARLARERAIWLVTWLKYNRDPAWRSMLEELDNATALTRRARQIENRFLTLRRRFEETA